MDIVFYFGDKNENVMTSDIVKDGFTLTEIYYNGLKPADGSVKLKIPYDMKIADKLKECINRNIKVRIEDGADGAKKNVFTGYLQKSEKFEKTQRNQPISLTVNSPSYFLDTTLEKGLVSVSKSVDYIIRALLKQAGVTAIGSLKVPQVLPYFTAEKGDKIKDILSELCFEYGKTYFFDESGVFQLRELFSDLPFDLTEVKQTFDGTNCLDKITVSAKEHEADCVRATYKGVEAFQNTLLFSDTQGKADGDKCQIEIKKYSYIFDEKYNECEYDSELGEVLYVKSIRPDVKFDSGVDYSLNRYDADGVDLCTAASLYAYNNTGSKKYCRKLDIYGDAFIQTKTNTVVSSTGTKEKEIELKYIYDGEDAKDFARNLANYYRYSNFTISVKSRDDFALGSFCKVTDYGMGTILARITKKVKKLTECAITYTLEAVSEYEPCTADEYSSTISSNQNMSGKNGIAGEKGEQGERGDAGSTIYCYLENDNITFGVDTDGKSQAFSADFPAHVISNYKELPFRIGKISYARGMKITPLFNCPAVKNGVHLELEEGTELTGNGSIKIEVIYNDIEESHLYGRITDTSAKVFKDPKLDCALGGFTYKKGIVPVIYELEITWALTKIGVYRGAMNSIHGFLMPDTETPLYFSDYFTWTGLESATETYNGHEVTFLPARVYKWNGTYWVLDDSDDHNSVALSDVLACNKAFLEENNSTVTLFLNRLITNDAFIDRLVANTAFIEKLFAKVITINRNGYIQSENFKHGKKGFRLTANGTFECVDGLFNGAIDTGALVVKNESPGSVAFAYNPGGAFWTMWETLREKGVFEGTHWVRGVISGVNVVKINIKVTENSLVSDGLVAKNYGRWGKKHEWTEWKWNRGAVTYWHHHDGYDTWRVKTYRDYVTFTLTTEKGHKKTLSGYRERSYVTQIENKEQEGYNRDGCKRHAKGTNATQVSEPPQNYTKFSGVTEGKTNFVLDEDTATLQLKNIPRSNYSCMKEGTVYLEGNTLKMKL